jgi:chemotaxis response regulator CheB
MIVDDAAMTRSVLNDLVGGDARFEVVALCEHGKRALEALTTVQPDLILLDVEMPVMDGPSFMRFARVKTRARIVVLSAAATVGSQRARELRRWGADAIVDKPSGSVSPSLSSSSRELLEVLERIAV